MLRAGDGRFLKNAFFEGSFVFFVFKAGGFKTEMGWKDASLIFFGECARNEKNILNDRGVVKKSPLKGLGRKNTTRSTTQKPRFFQLFFKNR